MAQRIPTGCASADALATRVLFDEDNAPIGVEYLKGERPLPRPSRRPRREPASDAAGPRAREVILAGGAFNTPQLLMLSGIGPRAELRALGIACASICRASAATCRTATRSASSIA